MKLLKKLEFPDAKFDLYFLGYDSPKALSHGNVIWDRQGVIELTHNYGTENDPNYKVNNGMFPPACLCFSRILSQVQIGAGTATVDAIDIMTA
jgi:hypothetical protein